MITKAPESTSDGQTNLSAANPEADPPALAKAYQSQLGGAEAVVGGSSGGRLLMIPLADVVAAEIHRRASNPPPLPPPGGSKSTSHSHVAVDRPPHGHLSSDGGKVDEEGEAQAPGKSKGAAAAATATVTATELDEEGMARVLSAKSMGSKADEKVGVWEGAAREKVRPPSHAFFPSMPHARHPGRLTSSCHIPPPDQPAPPPPLLSSPGHRAHHPPTPATATPATACRRVLRRADIRSHVGRHRPDHGRSLGRSGQPR